MIMPDPRAEYKRLWRKANRDKINAATKRFRERERLKNGLPYNFKPKHKEWDAYRKRRLLYSYNQGTPISTIKTLFNCGISIIYDILEELHAAGHVVKPRTDRRGCCKARRVWIRNA
jgi:DNA invertase Pin-like site-specific DNA recombinase